jgi:transcriptional regulator with XRE-family HTH domain
MQEKKLALRLRSLRVEKNLQLRKAAAALDVDQSLLSKYERGQRLPNERFLKKAAQYFSCDEEELLALLWSERFLNGVPNIKLAGKALRIAEQQVRYHAGKKP